MRFALVVSSYHEFITSRLEAGARAEFDPAWAVTLVLASAGYPASSSKGDVITGLDEAATLPDVQVFHAGTKLDPAGRLWLLDRAARCLLLLTPSFHLQASVPLRCASWSWPRSSPSWPAQRSSSPTRWAGSSETRCGPASRCATARRS